MPELPEVETVRRDVHAEFVGRVVEDVRASGVRTLRRHVRPKELVERTRGRKLVDTSRRGKYLLLRLDSSDVVVVHLGMSGQLLRAAAGDPPVKHTHVVFGFEGGADLRFVDPRTFGEVFVAGPAGVDTDLAELAHLGLDPLGGPGTEAGLARMLAGRTTRLKPLLMDQSRIAGIGNMYADEILFEAGLRFDRPAGTLTGQEVGRLFRAMTGILTRAIEHRGSSLADEQYRDLHGRLGDFQRFHLVYAREGAPCPRCATPIARARVGGRSNFYCPDCQR